MKRYLELILNTKLAKSAPEIWRPIPGYNGLYDASNLGRIKSFRKKTHVKKDIIMKPKIYAGNLFVELHGKKIKRKSFTVYRLVAKTFIPNPDDKPDVIHKNGIKANNEVSNLLWATKSENYFNARKNGRQTNKLSESDIQWVIKTRKEKSIQYKDIGLTLHVKEHVISDIFRRLRKANGIPIKIYQKRGIKNVTGLNQMPEVRNID